MDQQHPTNSSQERPGIGESSSSGGDQQYPQQPGQYNVVPKKSNVMLWGLIGVLVIILIGAAVLLFVLLGGGRSTTSNPEAYEVITETNAKRISLIRTLQGQPGTSFYEEGFTSVAFSPDGRVIAAGSLNDTVQLWQVADGALLHTLEGHTNNVNSIAFSSDGQHLASASSDKTVKVWRVSDEATLQTLQVKEPVESVTFAGCCVLYTGSNFGKLQEWSVQDGALMKNLDNESISGLAISDLAVSPDGSLLASTLERVDDPDQVHLWDRAGQLQRSITEPASISSIAFCPDGQTIVGGTSSGQIYPPQSVFLWRVPNGERIWNVETQGADVACSPNAELIVVSYNEGIRLLRTRDGQLIHTVAPSSRGAVSVRAVAISPDGRFITTATRDNTLQVWGVR